MSYSVIIGSSGILFTMQVLKGGTLVLSFKELWIWVISCTFGRRQHTLCYKYRISSSLDSQFQNLVIRSFLIWIFVYLKFKVTEKEGKREIKRDLASTGWPPHQMAMMLGWTKPKSRVQNSFLVSKRVAGSSALGQSAAAASIHINREQDGKENSWDLKQYSEIDCWYHSSLTPYPKHQLLIRSSKADKTITYFFYSWHRI